MSPTDGTYFRRGTDHLGILGANLRNLQGYRTLAHELIQNADDSRASTMSFEVLADALIVENNQAFTDCTELDRGDCPWLSERGYLCDFHRFQNVGAGNKRAQGDTIGAFGIGFTAVYQVTDRPELISAGRHWHVDEMEVEERRIRQCDGCDRCRVAKAGTTFVLPWARDPASGLRKKLVAEAVPEDVAGQVTAELTAALSPAMVFLRHVSRIELRGTDGDLRVFERQEEESDRLLLSDSGGDNQRWQLIRASFDSEAQALRARHVGIEVGRRALVTLAVPLGVPSSGLLYASLPTQHWTGLSFHVDGDFYPSTDRKRVILGTDYQGEWNKAALLAAAKALAEHIETLRDVLGATALWDLIDATSKGESSDDSSPGSIFWSSLKPSLKTKALVCVSTGQWVKGADAVFLLQAHEYGALGALSAIDLRVVHEDLRPRQNLLTGQAGVPVLTVERLARALVDQGLDIRRDPDSLPLVLSDSELRDQLWSELHLLLVRLQPPSAHEAARKRVASLAIAPLPGGAFWPCSDVFTADDTTAELFTALVPSAPFVSNLHQFDPLAALCRSFGIRDAVDLLSGTSVVALQRAFETSPETLQALFNWVANHRAAIEVDEDLKARLRVLPLFPSVNGLRALDQLALPGGFDDPLDLAEVLDLSSVGEHRDLVRMIGVRTLDFKTYADRYLIPAWRDGLTVEQRRRGFDLLVSRLADIRDDETLRHALTTIPIVECGDGEFRNPGDVYFDEPAVRECFQGSAHTARLQSDRGSARALLECLGVDAEPRWRDLLLEVRRLSEMPYSHPTKSRLQGVISHISSCLQRGVETEFGELKGMRWLPAQRRHDRWYRPDELYTTFRSYLFESRGVFIDLPLRDQQDVAALLALVGVKSEPPVHLVVEHLLDSAVGGLRVRSDVYEFLNRNVDDPSVSRLRGKRCLSSTAGYRTPDEVFWMNPNLGRYRWRLDSELRPHERLLRQLGVRDEPATEDAVAVLRELSIEFGSINRPLDDEAERALMSCWRMIDRGIADGVVPPEVIALSSVKCVPNDQRLLIQPLLIFFDDRPGLAQKFGGTLTHHVIERPLEVGSAMMAGGVRLLSDAVATEVVDEGDPRADAYLRDMVSSRSDLIGRVLHANFSPSETMGALRLLSQLRFQMTETLRVRYRLSVLNRQVSAAEEVQALFQDQDGGTLLVCQVDGHYPWNSLAKELALALIPGRSPGQLAPGLKEVLVSATVRDAAGALDEMGLANLDTSVFAAPSVSPEIDSLGDTEDSTESSETPSQPAGSTHVSPDSSTSMGRAIQSHPAANPAASSGQEAAQSPVERQRSPSTRRERFALRSYVLPLSDAAPSESEGDAGKRSDVDSAGIQRVIEFEKQAGRIPMEMPHWNPGYDVESRDASGTINRYIEVKSTSFDWQHAQVSSTQFEFAREHGEVSWLYVVERADSEDFEIHRIQDPARKVSQFLFDDGWRDEQE